MSSIVSAAFLDEVAPAVCDDLHLDVGPAVVGAQVLVWPGKHRPDDVLAAGEHEGTSVGSVCWASTVMATGRAR
jgi:hypothetical protein